MEDEFKIITKTEMGILIKNKMKNGLTYPKAQAQLFVEIEHLDKYYSTLDEKDKETLKFKPFKPSTLHNLMSEGRDTFISPIKRGVELKPYPLSYLPKKKRTGDRKDRIKRLCPTITLKERFV